jgi:hypothetical protein
MSVMNKAYTITSSNTVLATAKSAYDILVAGIPSLDNPPVNGVVPAPYGYNCMQKTVGTISPVITYSIVASFLWQYISLD